VTVAELIWAPAGSPTTITRSALFPATRKRITSLENLQNPQFGHVVYGWPKVATACYT
jgi:hypothetical protein